MAPTLPALSPPLSPAELSTSTQPSSAVKRASNSPTAPLERKRKTPPLESTTAKTSDATQPASKKKLVLGAPCHAGSGGQSSKVAAQEKSARHQSGKDALAHKAKNLDQMREMYPHLIDEAMALVEPAVLEGVLPRTNLVSACSSNPIPPSIWSPAMAPTSSVAAVSSSSPSAASSKPDVIILSSDDEQEANRWKRSPLGGSKPIVMTPRMALSSSDEVQEASSSKMSSSAGSKAGPVVLTSSDSDSGVVLLANCRKRRLPCNMAWLFSDEVSILTALADERLVSGQVPDSPSALVDVIRRRINLKRENATDRDVAKKVHNLKERFKKVIASGGPSGERRDRKLYDLSVKVWPEHLPSTESISSLSSSSNGTCTL